MGSYSQSAKIAQVLAGLWISHRNRAFLVYLSNTFGYETITLPHFSRIYIAEISSGDAKKGIIGSDVTRWWSVDEKGLREIDVDLIDFQVDGDFYCTPVLKFFTEENWIAVGEKLGPSISCRKVGLLKAVLENSTSAYLDIAWTHNARM